MKQISRKMQLSVLMILMALVSVLLVPVRAHAALKLAGFDAPVKVNGYYYKSDFVEAGDRWDVAFVRSTRKNGKYQTIMKASSDKRNSDYFTDGSKIYYFEKYTLKSYNMKTKKKAVVKRLSFPADHYLSVKEVNGNDIYVLARSNGTKYEGVYLYRINVKTKKATKILRNVFCANPVTGGKYMMLVNKDAQTGKYTLKSYNILNGEKKVITTEADTLMQYAAGGNGYSMLAKKECFGTYDASTATMTLYKYTFSTGALSVLGTVPNCSGNEMIMWGGNMVYIVGEDGMFDESRSFAF